MPSLAHPRKDFNPRDKTPWFTDNQTDGMGDDIPMGEINRAIKPGEFFGYPYIVSKTRITETAMTRIRCRPTPSIHR